MFALLFWRLIFDARSPLLAMNACERPFSATPRPAPLPLPRSP